MLDWLRGSTSKRTRRETTARDDGAIFDDAFQKRLEYLSIVSRRVFAGRNRAERRSKKTGTGIEFADHRPYTPGDDFRYLDWKVYGRLGRLLLRLFEEEEDLSVYLLIDVSASMGFGDPSKLRYAKQLTAALAYIGLAHLDRVSIIAFSNGVQERLAPTRGKNRIFTIFEFLRSLQPQDRTDLASSMRSFVAQHKRRGVAVLISDLYDAAGVEEGLNTLRYARFEPYVLHVVDPVDARPTLRGDLRLVDAETGESKDATITASVLQRYERAHAEYRRSLQDFCTSKHVPFFALDTQTPFDEAMLRILRHGGVVR